MEKGSYNGYGLVQFGTRGQLRRRKTIAEISYEHKPGTHFPRRNSIFSIELLVFSRLVPIEVSYIAVGAEETYQS